jgi:hypothetical protein
MASWKTWTGGGVLALVLAATFVIGGLSIWFVEDGEPFPYSARVLISTFAAGMTLLGAVALWRTAVAGSRPAWAALWAYPAFFVSHVILLGTYLPDLVLAAVAAGALVLLWPGGTGGPQPVAGSAALQPRAK